MRGQKLIRVAADVFLWDGAGKRKRQGRGETGLGWGWGGPWASLWPGHQAHGQIVKTEKPLSVRSKRSL